MTLIKFVANYQASKFCPECGAPMAAKGACGTCGAQLAPGAKFCPECGQKTG